MSRIKTIIVDDEPRNVKLLSRLIKDYCPSLEVTGTASDLTEAKLLIRDTRPALLLTDIRFPAGTIFSMLEDLPFKDFHIIFVTGHNTYASEAFGQNAIDYILKPVTKEALVNAVRRFEAKRENNAEAGFSKIVKELKSGLGYPKKIALPSAEGILFINETDIARCEASGRYSVVYLNSMKKITVAKTLKEMETILHSKLFFRIHQSHIINLDLVKKYNKGRTVELTDGTSVEVSLARKDEFLEIFFNKE